MKEFEDILEEINHNLEWCDDAYQSRCYRRSHDEITRLRADLAAVTAEWDRLREVVKRADSYIHNGIELGFIRHCDTPEDPAYHTPRIVREAARAALEGVMEPASPWRDIESAPKDMKILVAGKKDDGTDYQEVCKYFDAANCWPIVLMDGYLAPTHWMHLQDPPANTQTGER